MKEILLSLLQFINKSGQFGGIKDEYTGPSGWLNAKKHQLFLNAEEIFFGEDWVKLLDGDAETYIDWEEMEFFHYPFVGLNIKLPGFTRTRYFSLIVREKMEDHPLLNEFICCMREQSETCRSFNAPACFAGTAAVHSGYERQF